VTNKSKEGIRGKEEAGLSIPAEHAAIDSLHICNSFLSPSILLHQTIDK